jgi:hypothetical protein
MGTHTPLSLLIVGLVVFFPFRGTSHTGTAIAMAPKCLLTEMGVDPLRGIFSLEVSPPLILWNLTNMTDYIGLHEQYALAAADLC